jgi:hypothetical protein
MESVVKMAASIPPEIQNARWKPPEPKGGSPALRTDECETI